MRCLAVVPWLLTACLVGWTGHNGGKAWAGQLSDAEAAQHLAPPLRLGPRMTDLPAWPVFDNGKASGQPAGYLFESVDIAPVPGFSGHPINLLIGIDTSGNFIHTEVLSQHEPMFVEALGQKPLERFVRYYLGHNLRQHFSIVPSGIRAASVGDGREVALDGVTTATVSVRLTNQTILTAATAVARARLAGVVPSGRGAATVRKVVFQRKKFAELLADGDIAHRRWLNREVEALFGGGPGAGLDAEALARPDAVFVDTYVADLNVPTIGRALLGDAAYAALMRRSVAGAQYYWVAASGRHSLIERSFTPRSVPANLNATQDGIPIELRDADLALSQPAGAPLMNAMLVLATPPQSGLDIGRAVQFGLDVTRRRGLMQGLDVPNMPKLAVRKTLNWDYQVPDAYLDRPAEPLPEWLESWRAAGGRLGVLGAALAVLVVFLARPRWLSVAPRRLWRFRTGFLIFTLVYIGWYAQGQLSVVHLTSALQALASGKGLGSFLYDPVTLALIIFTAASVLVWGRGTFCGWLCPFGALQELATMLARRLRLPARRVPEAWVRRLAPLRHVVLVLLLGAALVLPPTVLDGVLEIEPFKTSISLGFIRSWPFVVYALAWIALGAVYYKFFCRFVCPLGAAMTWGGKLRRWDWLPRRPDCGKPCQTCRHRCQYDAIARDGQIHYGRCFQCLDCVGIYHDPKRCAPLLLKARKGRAMPVVTQTAADG